MSKIVCDICGTTYPDTAEECPICGCAKDAAAALLGEELLEATAEPEVDVDAAEVEAAVAEASEAGKRGLFGRRKAAPVVEDEDDDEEDFEDEDEEYEDDEEDEAYEDDDDDEDDEDDDDDEEGQKSNALLVVLLVIVILALLAVSAFILIKYVAPNVLGPKETAPATTVATDAPTETTELVIPCENLALTSGGEIVLEAEGANWLINVLALPENTTDELVYSSSDESVATVNEQGKITAVGEGTAVITITCGAQELKCTVTVSYPAETTVPATDPSEGTEPEDSTEPEETTAPTEPTAPLKDIDLAKAINYKELTFNGPNQGVTVKIQGLDNKEVKWSSEDESVATVDENGRILNTGKGTTYIVVRYGDQEVKIKIICKW